MQSLESKELVTCRYAWRNLYWFVTDAGIEYLREYLNVPAEVVPATLMKSTRCVPLTSACLIQVPDTCWLDRFNSSSSGKHAKVPETCWLDRSNPSSSGKHVKLQVSTALEAAME